MEQKLIGFYAPKATHELVRLVAKMEGVSMSAFARNVLADAAAERLAQLEAVSAIAATQ